VTSPMRTYSELASVDTGEKTSATTTGVTAAHAPGGGLAAPRGAPTSCCDAFPAVWSPSYNCSASLLVSQRPVVPRVTSTAPCPPAVPMPASPPPWIFLIDGQEGASGVLALTESLARGAPAELSAGSGPCCCGGSRRLALRPRWRCRVSVCRRSAAWFLFVTPHSLHVDGPCTHPILGGSHQPPCRPGRASGVGRRRHAEKKESAARGKEPTITCMVVTGCGAACRGRIKLGGGRYSCM